MLAENLVRDITALGLVHSIEGNADKFTADALSICVRVVNGKPTMKVEVDEGHNQSIILAVGDLIQQKTTCINHSLHPETRELLIQFSADLGQKLLKSQIKYGLDKGWRHPPSGADSGDGRFFMSEEQCNIALLNHLKKGDIIDVAAYLAFMNANNWKIDTTMFT